MCRTSATCVMLVASRTPRWFSPSAGAVPQLRCAGCAPLGQTVPSHEIVNVEDGAPYQAGGDWFIDRATTVLPLCNYINAAENPSLDTHSLAPEEKRERAMICREARPSPFCGAVPRSSASDTARAEYRTGMRSTH